MSTLTARYEHVVGVDTHARTHTYAIVESATGALVATETFPNTSAGHKRALAWIERRSRGDFLAAIECVSTYGATLVASLREGGVALTEARPPKRGARRHGKSDAIDAEAAARSVLGRELGQLSIPRDGKERSALRILLAARRSLDSRRTADRNALIALLRSVDLGVDTRRAPTETRIRSIAAWTHGAENDIETVTARDEAARLARSVIAVTAELKTNKRGLLELVAMLAPGLLKRVGVGPVTAAVFLTAWSHPGRIRSEAAFASLAGVAPIPASSGNTVRHRLSRHGDRQLNRALDVVARARMACDPDTKAFTAERQARGKTAEEIRRILKRYIARQIHRELVQTFGRPVGIPESPASAA